MPLYSLGKSTVTIESFSTLAQCARQTVSYLEKKFVGFSGGTTYASLYPYWQALHPDVAHTVFLPVDERAVPITDPQSNWGTANKLFFHPLGIDKNIQNFASDARSYIRLLSGYFCNRSPVFDTIFLGVGSDGHVASLFPGNTYLNDLDSIVLETTSPLPPPGRTTLAFKPLIAAKNLVIIVATPDKKEILKRVWKNDTTLPIVQVLNKREKSILFLEESLATGARADLVGRN